LESLANVAREKVQSEPSLTLDQLFRKYSYASFGLPSPLDGHALLGGSAAGKAIAEALSTWWTDTITIETTVQQLAHHPDTVTTVHPFASLDWTDFDRMRAADGNHLMAVGHYSARELSTNICAFAELTERQFFDPLSNATQVRFLAIYGDQDEDLTPGPSADFGPFILTSTKQISADGGALLVSEEVRILIPTIASASSAAVAGTGLSVRTLSPRVTWAGTTELGADGNVWARGHFTRELGKNVIARPVLLVRIKVEVDADDSLASYLDTSASCEFVLLPPVGRGLFFMRFAKAGLGRPKFLGSEKYDLTLTELVDQERYAADLKDSKSVHVVVLWNSVDDDSVRFEDRAVPLLKSRKGIHIARVVPQSTNEFTIGDATYELSAASGVGLYRSPIVAAIDNQTVSSAKPTEETMTSVQGKYEMFVADHIGDSGFIEALGHLAVPEDQDFDFERVELDPSGILMDVVTSAIKLETNFKVHHELLHSVQADAFREAFTALGVAEAIQVGTAEDPRSEWPSRTSWRFLWEGTRGPLENYLLAYTELVEFAKSLGHAHGIFWATYPFALSVWNTSTAICPAVLLSPLHPLRLAWLAGVESSLWDADNAALLAGTVEGWNFPVVGPSETDNGRLVALPTDSGDGQVFLGWAMLVQSSINGYQSLSAPLKIGGMPAPGNAASGLNSTAVAAALRSYKNMHPHVSTLTVDLAAAAPTSRLQEVDTAVLTAVKTWSTGTISRLAGGVRVWDSVNRQGVAPREDVTQLASGNEDLPFSWTRYFRKPGEPSKTCNIRLLQDSGIRLQAGSGAGGNLGLIGQAALRRFEAHEPPVSDSEFAESRPTLLEGVGWPAFGRALRMAEGSSSKPHIRSMLQKVALVDESADWTVSGEGLMGPSAMAGLIQNNGAGAQMLWEWQPPFLGASEGVPLLERRPFVSVARVPKSFRAQLKSLLEKAQGAPVADEAVGKLLGKLGARGVGLSSLLSMGGTHAAGALGFYLSFSLMDGIESDDADQFVLPIDASDSFIRALAGGTSLVDSTRRADLLIVRIDDEAVTLVPIEIKLHGLMGAAGAHALPKPGDSELRDALDQLASTHKLLMQVAAKSAELHHDGQPADRILWDNALATLIEAGARLQPPESALTGRLASRIHNVVEGRLPVRVGKPIVTFFQHNSVAVKAKPYEVHLAQTDRAAGEYGALMADVGSAFAAVDLPHAELVNDWGRLVAWSVKSEQASSQTAVVSKVEPFSPDAGTATDGTEVSATESSNYSEGELGVSASANETALERIEQAKEPSVPLLEVEQLDPVLEDLPRAKDIRAVRVSTTPPSSMGVKFPVGRLLDSVGPALAEFWPGNTALNQMNIGVVGDLGTGKTELLKTVISELRSHAKRTQVNPLSFLVLDYKRDYQEEDFVKDVGAEVLLPNRIPLNIFSLPGEYSKLAAFQKGQEFADVLSKIYGGVGPVQRARIARLTATLFAAKSGQPPTIAEVAEAYRAEVSDDSVTAILDTFVYGEIFSDNPSELTDFDSLIRDKVLVVAIDRLGVDQKTKNALVVLFLNMYYDYMIRSRKFPFTGSDPQIRQLSSFLLVDEATNIMEYEFPVLMALMLQGRQFGFGTILASQYLSHFKTSKQNYGQPLLTWFIHKVPNVTDLELTRLGISGLPSTAAARIGTLETHEALYKSYGFSGSFIRGTPFYELNLIENGT
jgi:DNA phosphorothioation-dependent restriction protein DptH